MRECSVFARYCHGTDERRDQMNYVSSYHIYHFVYLFLFISFFLSVCFSLCPFYFHRVFAHHTSNAKFNSLSRSAPFSGSCQIHGSMPMPQSESDDLSNMPDIDNGSGGMKSPIMNNPAFSHSRCPPEVHRSCFCVRFIAEHTKLLEDSTKASVRNEFIFLFSIFLSIFTSFISHFPFWYEHCMPSKGRGSKIKLFRFRDHQSCLCVIFLRKVNK